MWRWPPPWHWARRCGRRTASQMNKIAVMSTPFPDAATLEQRQRIARNWFEHLRDDICAAFEGLEDALPVDTPLAGRPSGRFERTSWRRTDHAGGEGGGGV